MKKNLLFFILLILSIFNISIIYAENLEGKICETNKGDIGIGIIIGEPTGLSFKLFTADNRAIDVALAWALKKKQYIRIHVDYLFNDNECLIREFGLPLSLDYGFGIKLITGTNFTTGVRFYGGVFHRFKSPNIELFLELVPSMIIIPATIFDVDGAMGLRFFLKKVNEKNR